MLAFFDKRAINYEGCVGSNEKRTGRGSFKSTTLAFAI
jgi:hypothetical protein